MARLAGALRRALRADHHHRAGRVDRGDRGRRRRGPLDAGVIAAALLGITVAACLWWSYFDWVVFVAQATLAEATGARRAALARDAYSYLHLPMVAGIVLFAFGLKTTLADAAGSLRTVPALGLVGGIALYLLAHVVLRLRIGAGLGRERPVATVVLLGLLPVAREVPALTALALVAAVCWALIAYEALRHREGRAWIRSHRGAFHGRGLTCRTKPPEGPPFSGKTAQMTSAARIRVTYAPGGR